jgi:UDP-glucose 4-epimerase
MKNYLLVTGGAGFIGSSLIEYLLKKTSFKIISYDNYASGNVKNHIKDKRVNYLKGHTKDINSKLFNYKKKIHSLFHLGEFSRIYQSFLKINDCFDSNITGTKEVLKFCLDNKIKLVYSATSASLGRNGKDENLSPYAWSKSTNIKQILNLNRWFGLKFEIVYFYNVYGPRQILNGDMAAVIGIFENCYKKNKSLPIVYPGTQTRKFTHVKDTVKCLFYAWKKNLNKHYAISSPYSYSIIKIANLFGSKKTFINSRPGERFKSKILKNSGKIRIINIKAKIKIIDYIQDFKKSLLDKRLV